MKTFTQHLFLLVSLFLVLTGLNAQTPVANYTFDGNAKDLSVNDNTGLVSGAYLTQDRFGVANNAFQFDGEQSFIMAPNNAALNSDFTSVAFWIKVNELPPVGEAYPLSFGGWQERWKVSLPGHGKMVWTTNNSSGISDMDAGDGNELVEGVWTHVVLIHDGTKDRIYINGVQIAEKDVTGTMNSTTAPLGLGYNPIDGGNYFNGDLDEIQVYDIALSDSEIAALYAVQSMPPNFGETIVASYLFDGDATDNTQFGNHGRTMDVSSATDRFGIGESAWSFNGSSSTVEATGSAQLNSDFTTISFWVRPNSLPATGEAFLMSNGGWQERWKLSLPAHGKPVFTTNNSSGISDMDSGDGNELVPGAWTHVVLTHDGTQDRIFMDGALVAAKDVAGTLNSTQYPLGIGFNPIDGGNYFDGVIDDVQIWNYSFTVQEVEFLYDQQVQFPGTPSSLVANYMFSSNTIDSSIYRNPAMGEGAHYSADRFGYASNAGHFAGSDGLTAANSSALNSDYTTVAFWINADALPASGEAFLLSNGGWQERWKISVPSHGKPVFTTNASSGISDMDAGDGNEIVPGQWQHFAFVHDGTNDLIYLNGVLASSKAVDGTLNATTYPLGIGFDPIGNTNFFEGSLDDIRIYDVAMTDVEIAALYDAQNQPPMYDGELVANYTFSGDSRDHSPFNNDANVSGAQLADDRFDLANMSYTFDGMSAAIEAENSPQLNTPYTSISFWINPEELPATGEYFVLSHGGWQERWKISLPGHGKLVWTTNNSSGISDMDAGDGNELVAGTWRHVVMVHADDNDYIYMDGVQVAEKAVGGTMNSTTSNFGIGYNVVDGGGYFYGGLDEVQVYNVALTAQQIADLYAAQSQPPASTDDEAPTAPLNLRSGVEFNNISLSWLPSSDNVAVTGYNVYQDEVKVMTTNQTMADFIGVQPLTQFKYEVTAVDAAGNESLPSSLLVTSGADAAPDTIKPTAPGNLNATTSSNSVLLTWDPSTDNVQVGGYIVLVDGLYQDSLGAAATSVFIGGLDPETFYTFEVYAYDISANVSDISEITVSTDEEINTGEPGLVAWYPFEGNANDATPYENHGVEGGNPTYESVTLPNGASGQAIVFDGDGDSVLAANAVQLISDYTSVGFWIRVDAVTTDAEAYVLDFGHWSQRWKISLPQHLKIVWTTNSKNTVSDNFIHDMDSGDGNELIESFWWHVTMVHDGVNDIIYLNGQEVNNLPAAGILNSTSFPLGMGNNPIEGGQYFTGALDDVKIYNRALTADEVELLYSKGNIVGTHNVQGNDLLQVVDKVYPNPVIDRLFIEHHLNSTQDAKLYVYDAMGRQVDYLLLDRSNLDNGMIELNVANYMSGSYFLQVEFGGRSLGSIHFHKH